MLLEEPLVPTPPSLRWRRWTRDSVVSMRLVGDWGGVSVVSGVATWVADGWAAGREEVVGNPMRWAMTSDVVLVLPRN